MAQTLRQKSSFKNTGSFFNMVMGNNSTLPEVGKGATILLWTDRHAYEVMEVSDDKKSCIIEQYLPERVDKLGMSDHQEYKYEKTNGFKQKVVWRREKWRLEIKTIEFLDSYYKEYEQAKKEIGPLNARKQYIDSLFDGYGNLILVEGKTRVKKSYSPVNILFGQKREYYDFSF